MVGHFGMGVDVCMSCTSKIYIWIECSRYCLGRSHNMVAERDFSSFLYY